MVELQGQQFLIFCGERLPHGFEIHVQLIPVGHAGHGGVDIGITYYPLESGQESAVLFELLVRRRSGARRTWWRRADSNCGPTDYETVALAS